MSKLKFFIEGLKNFREVGTVTRSSPALAKKMVSFIDGNEALTIVELGAGDGVVTRYILDKMSPNSKLVSIELNKKLFKLLAEIDDPRLIPVCGNVKNLESILTDLGIEEIDVLLSAIPFIVMPKKEAESIVTTCKNLLKKGGYYIQVHYAKSLKKFYERIFGNISVHFVAMNVPPAYSFVCIK